MERVAFLIEATNEHISCMLNPEDLVVRRTAGIHVRQIAGGHLTGHGLADDPLLYTGGGRTELTLNLLFDVALAGFSLPTRDVRQLTAPMWNLTENHATPDGFTSPPLVRLLWGKHWNVCGVIVSIAERLEEFTPGGAPGRSWMRLKMLRVQPPEMKMNSLSPLSDEAIPEPLTDETLNTDAWMLDVNPNDIRYHEIIVGQRLDQISSQYYGRPHYWRLLASFNNISNTDELPAGFQLQIPPAPNVVWQLLSKFENLSARTQTTFSSLMRVSHLSSFRVQI